MRRFLVPLLFVTGCGTVTAPFVDTQMPAQDVTLSITHSGAGAGVVTSSPAGIDCGTSCSTTVAAGTQITLTAAPDATSAFMGWNGGGCLGTGPCTLTITNDTSIDAAFAKAQVTVTVAPAGNGTGAVASAPAGISCGATCAAKFDAGTSVTLTATPDASSTFLGWTGAGCAASGPCTFVASADTTVQAAFALDDTLVVTRAGNGGGAVTSGDGAIDCGASCSHQYAPGTKVTLTAAADAHSDFGGWSGGGCSGTGACVVTIDAATGVTATFTLKKRTLTVAKSGTGAGTIASSDGAIDCGATCSHAFDDGTVVTLTATPATGSTFAGWSGGGCSGTGTCQVTLSAATTVTATFTLQQLTLTVATGGNGAGTVTSSPTGIACGNACSAGFAYGTTVTLTAAPAANSTFTGWSGGGCNGTGPCVVTIAAATSVTATFTLQQYTLTAARSGGGAGAITSSDGGIDCGASCSHTYDAGTVVALTASPSTGSTFSGWSGACTGAGACNVTMSGAKSVTATFALTSSTLSVQRTGTGGGSVASTDGKIGCPGACSASYTYGSVVTLAATPATGSTFAGWSGGGCGGTGACTVTVDAATTVTAQFTANPYTLATTRSGTGAGTVTSADGGIDCGGTCSASYAYGTLVTLTATAATGSTFAGWSGGGCSGTGTCTVDVTAATSVDAQFTLNQYTLTVTNTSTVGGSGGVTSNVGGINCGNACSATLGYGTTVTLTATATNGSTFAGWSGGGCSGTGTCSITMTASTPVTATFTCAPVTFGYTGSAQTYTAPACATRVHVEAWGAQGATGQGSIGGVTGLGGLGGYAKGDLAVTAGQTFTVMVGGQAGWNGGGAGVDDLQPANGGDASDVRSGGTGLGNRIVIAGGGGGGVHSGDGNFKGGAGGGGTCGTGYCGGGGGFGLEGNGGPGSTAPGSGVTATDAGGAGGGGTDGGGIPSCETRYNANGICGARGQWGVGGAGDAQTHAFAPNCYGSYGGTAGGGGGAYGGGGSSVGNCGGGGGGGGSSTVSQTLSSIVLQGGVRTGLGQVVITPF